MARRPKGNYEGYVNQASSIIISVTVEIEITATDANTVLPEYSSLQNPQPIWNYIDEGEQMF